MRTYTQKEIGFIKQQVATLGDDLAFYFIPSAELRRLILKKEHPNVCKLPLAYVDMFLRGTAVLLDSQLIIDYLEERASRENEWLLSLGEIRVVSNTFKISKEGK